jgi:hypothetical protein
MRSLLGRFHRPFARSVEEQLLLLNNLGDGSTLSLDFTTGVLDPRLTFTRTTNATFINSQGYVEFAGQNVLVQTANMTLWSTPTNIDTSAWGSKSDPFGGTTAVRLTPTGTVTSAQHYLGSASVSSATLGNGLRTVYSVYAKAATSRYRIFGMVVDNGNAQASFVLTGAGEGTATTHLGTNVSAYMTAIGDGWYRCVMTWPSSTTSASCWCAILANNTTVPSGQTFVAQSDDVSGGHGIFVYGAQWEHGSIPHAFIPTTSSAKSDTPRFDYDPTTIGTPRGLLIEGSATNLLKYSAYADTNWIAYGGYTKSYTTGITSPANDTTAARIVFSAVGHGLYTNNTQMGYTNNVGDTYTISAWIRATSNTTNPNIRFGDSAVAAGPNIAISTSWVRYSYSYVAASTSGPLIQSASGTATGEFEMWGFQLEAGGSGASSYIPTGASTGSRAADECYTDSMAWFSAGQPYSMLFRYSMNNPTAWAGTNIDRAVGQLSVGGAGNRTFMYAAYRVASGSSDIGRYVRVFDTNTLDMFPATLPAAVSNTSMAFAVNANDSAISASNDVLGTDASNTILSGQNRLHIGSIGTAQQMNGCISSVKYWPLRLPNATLQALTT